MMLTSSVESVEGYVLVCPNITVTFTCSDILKLLVQNGLLWYCHLPLSAGCSPPTPPVNGSVDEWTIVPG